MCLMCRCCAANMGMDVATPLSDPTAELIAKGPSVFDMFLHMSNTVSYTHLTLPTKRIV